MSNVFQILHKHNKIISLDIYIYLTWHDLTFEFPTYCELIFYINTVCHWPSSMSYKCELSLDETVIYYTPPSSQEMCVRLWRGLLRVAWYQTVLTLLHVACEEWNTVFKRSYSMRCCVLIFLPVSLRNEYNLIFEVG